MALQNILEDFHADLPGLPAFVVCTETDDFTTNNASLDPMDGASQVMSPNPPNDITDSDPSDMDQNAMNNVIQQNDSARSDRVVIEISDDDEVGSNHDDRSKNDAVSNTNEKGNNNDNNNSNGNKNNNNDNGNLDSKNDVDEDSIASGNNKQMVIDNH